jgi:hypothetical protein
MRGPSKFRQRDLMRAIRALSSTGTKGNIRIALNGEIILELGCGALVPEAANDNTWGDVDAETTAASR